MKHLMRRTAQTYLEKLLQKADIAINGSRDSDIIVKDPRFYEHVLLGGSLAFGESYMEGWWDCRALDTMFFKLLRTRLDRSFCNWFPELCKRLRPLLFNHQSRRRAFEVGQHHYDAGNDLFENMLDQSMTYSCGYWRDVEDLDQAQQAKLDLICRKLRLKPSMRMLDIGCGWGALSRYAAQEYGVEVVGLTVSEEQVKRARELCYGLPVEVRLQDYRDLSGSFDAIASVGMFEHVGYKNYRTFMDVVRSLLKEDGLFVLHTIGANRTVYSCDPWFDKYIFPNGMLPSIRQIGSAIEHQFIMEDWQNLGTDYEKTLLYWYRNFEKNWQKLKSNYSDRFFRMWRYYLLSMAGGFRARHIQVWQIVLSPLGSTKGYRSLRCPHC